MPRLVLAPALARWLPAATDLVGEAGFDLDGRTVAEVLNSLFRAQPGLRGYVLDEHAALRQHIALFIDGQPLRPKTELGRPLAPGSELYLMQALSGG